MTVRTPALLFSLCLAPPLAAQELSLLPGIPEIASDTIRDIAVASVDRGAPVIYYNPKLVRRYGPVLTRFFIAHEYGHVTLGHTRLGLADLAPSARDSALVAQELAADCFAAAQQGDDAIAATEAAVRFFSRLGPFRFDNVHPTGAQRAARVLACSPVPVPDAARSTGETGVEVGPVSGEPDAVRLVVRGPDPGTGAGGRAVLWLDGVRAGIVSNVGRAEPVVVVARGAGLHAWRVTVELVAPDGAAPGDPPASVSGRGQLLAREGGRFRIDWAPGQPVAMIPDPEPGQAAP